MAQKRHDVTHEDDFLEVIGMKRSDLKRYRWLKKDIRTLRAVIADLEDVVAPVAEWSDMPKGGGVGDPVGEIVARRDRLRAEYVKKLQELLKLQQEIEDWVAGLNEKHALVIRTMYIEGKTYMETIETLGMASRTVCRRLNEVLDSET